MSQGQTPPSPLFMRLPAIGLLDGWRRNGVAFVCGVFATLSLPPFFIVPLIVPAFTGLLWLLNGAPSRKRIFWDGWWWGWGFYMSGLYWFCIALLTDADKFAWLIPFALFGLTAVIAIYQGVACLLLSYVRATAVTRIFAFSVIWVLIEYARGHWFSGFPWNLAGYTMTVSDVSLQLASVLGAYGLTWLIVFVGMIPSSLGDYTVTPKHAVRWVSATYIVLALSLVWGMNRLEANETRFAEDVQLRLVQANIAQHHKWQPELQMKGVQKHATLTRKSGIENITHVIWPETAVPYIIKEDSPLVHMLALMLPPDTHLIAGTLRAEGEAANWKIYNSVIMLDSDGKFVGQYNKNKLVPFGEFLPFRSLIPKGWATPVGSTDFSRGKGALSLNWPGLDGVAPLICYEAIFPEFVAGAKTRPNVMLNVTNDAWFGASSAPYQHLHMSRMRATEQGVPLIRVANTGISAVIDGAGRIVARTELNAQAVLDSSLPLPYKKSTIYSRVGDKNYLLLMVSILLVFLLLQRRKMA